MKNIFIYLLFLGTILSGQSPAELGVSAIGYVVSDIKSSEKFYTEIIGMIPVGSFSLDEKWSKEAGAANGKPFSVKMFKMVNSPSATILKLAYFDKIDPRPTQSGIDMHPGVNYLTLNFADLDQVVARIESAGIPILGWVKRETFQLLFVRDPDGVFVELVGPPEDH